MSQILEIIKHRSFILTIVLTLVYFGLGMAFLHLGLADYGWVIFVLLPYSLGIAIGKMEKMRWAYLGFFIALIVFMVLVVIGHLEGIICAFMTVPIIIPLIWLGSVTNIILTNYGIFKKRNTLNVMLLPLLFVLFWAPVEKYFHGGEQEIIEVKTERVYPYTAEQVYDAIKSVDTLIAEKPFLMKIDLPVPNKCVLEKEEVGGLRTCYFSGGTITERITELEKAKVLRMDVIDYKLTGRTWLGFKEAIYYFDKVGADSCRMTRITTYTSVLRPRIYWQPLEEMGIHQEHDYVFDNLANDLAKNYRR